MYSIHFTLMSGLVLPPTLGQFPSCSRLTLLCRGMNKVHIAELPYSGKLSREKTFADRWKIRFSRRKLSRIACFCHAKGHHAPKFRGETRESPRTTKFMKVFRYTVLMSPLHVCSMCSWIVPHAAYTASDQLFGFHRWYQEQGIVITPTDLL